MLAIRKASKGGREVNKEEREKQNTIDIRSYDGTIEEELDGIMKELRIDRGRVYELNEARTRKLMSMRLKHTSEKLDVLSRRILHVT